MLRIFDRYIVRQILVSTTMAVMLLSVVLVLGQVFQKLLDGLMAGILPPSAVFKFMGFAFPMSLSFTIPWGVLTAVLLTFGRLSADNELISMRMAGISLPRICLPVFLVAGALSGFCLWLNTTVVPYAYTETSRMTRQALIRDPRLIFQPDRVVDQLPGHLMYVGDRQGDDLKNVQIIQMQDDGDKGRRGKPAGIIFAKGGRLGTDKIHERHALEFDATDTLFFTRDEAAPLRAEERLKMTPEQIARHEGQVEEQSKGPPRIFDFGTQLSSIPLNVNALFNKTSAVRVDALSMAEIQRGLTSPGSLEAAYPGVKVPGPAEIRTEWHRRISFSFACFVLALVGIPCGTVAQRRETSSGFVISLVVGISYYSLIMLGSLLSTKPHFYPHLWIWLPNVVFGMLGVTAFWRLKRK